MLPLISALIVDDEVKAVQLLKKLLEDSDHFSEIRYAYSASSAMQELRRYKPDIIFLDIKMPGQNGISFLRQLHQQNIADAEIVFVTAYDEFALEAIRNYAFGYLMKPVNREELEECIVYFKSKKIRSDNSERLRNFLETIDNRSKLRINTRSGYYFIDPHAILFCQADGNYTRIDLGDKNYLCSFQLGVIEHILPARDFLRAGRSLIVNYRLIANVDRKRMEITFEKGSKNVALKVSRSQLKELEKGMPNESLHK